MDRKFRLYFLKELTMDIKLFSLIRESSILEMGKLVI